MIDLLGIKGFFGVILVGVCIWLMFTVNSLKGNLQIEKLAHDATRQQRDTAIQEGLRWKALTESKDFSLAGVTALSQACLQREREVTADVAARTAIMQQTQPRKQTDMEKKEMVDDATRKIAVDRLNRPL